MTDRLLYLPLGGAGEIGMNAYVYGWGAPGEERLILVDLGVTFPNMDTTPGIDLILPDIGWLAERADRIEAIFITHAHEDHVGALGHLWSRLRAPVHARRFTAAIASRKLEEQGHDGSAVDIVAPWPATVDAGPFSVGFLPVSHSIPESSALVIDTPGGRVLHTGDFKLDTRPVVGEPFDRSQWGEVAQGGVHALVCDSTNVFSHHPGRSESVVGPEIERLVAAADGMVVATTFASNIARLKTLAEAGRTAGRSVCLLGRAMRRMVEVAVETGILTDFPSTVGPEDASEIPRQNLMLLATGSQGERRAASAQLSRGRYLGLQLEAGDTFLFSSKTIPGNERDVIRLVNAFSEMGVDVVDDSLDLYHVSGHANRPDLEEMHALVGPRMVVPMHGEHRHLRAHAQLAEAGGRPSSVAPNGTLLDLTGDRPRVVDQIEAGRTYLDGKVQIGQFDGIVRDRLRTAINGHVIVTLIFEEDDEPLGDPWCELIGLPERGMSQSPLAELMEDDLAQTVGRAEAKTLRDDGSLEDALRRRVRQVCSEEIGKKPEVTVVISRLTA
jgi:ribonuclease J